MIYALALAGICAASSAYAGHDADCKKPHGKVSVVTSEMISVDDKPYKVGKSTHVYKGDVRAKITDIKVGDTVCLDDRGKDDVGGGEIAAVAIIAPATTPAVAVKEQTIVREKTSFHDKNCPHTHARVGQVNETTLIVNGEPIAIGEHLIVRKGDQVVKVQTLKAGDIVCLHDENKVGVKEKITTVMVLDPSESYLVPESKTIERERIELR